MCFTEWKQAKTLQAVCVCVCEREREYVCLLLYWEKNIHLLHKKNIYIYIFTFENNMCTFTFNTVKIIQNTSTSKCQVQINVLFFTFVIICEVY